MYVAKLNELSEKHAAALKAYGIGQHKRIDTSMHG